MTLYKRTYSISNAIYDLFKKRLDGISILHMVEDGELERFLLPGTKVRVDVPKMREEKGHDSTKIEIVYDAFINPGCILTDYGGLPRDLKRILKDLRPVGTFKSGQDEEYYGQLIPSTVSH